VIAARQAPAVADSSFGSAMTSTTTKAWQSPDSRRVLLDDGDGSDYQPGRGSLRQRWTAPRRRRQLQPPGQQEQLGNDAIHHQGVADVAQGQLKVVEGQPPRCGNSSREAGRRRLQSAVEDNHRRRQAMQSETRCM
jgi:hypothetical protein